MSEAIAIVSMGCIFPQAASPEDVWRLCRSGKSAIRDLSKDRWNTDHHYSEDRTAVDKTYSRIAAEIPYAEFQNLLRTHRLPSETTRLEAYLVHSLSQIRPALIGVDSEKIGFVLGLMNPDEEYNHGLAQKRNQQIFSLLREQAKTEAEREAVAHVEEVCAKLRVTKWESSDRFLSSEVLQKVADRFGIQGLSFIVDAACASSLASIDIGVSLLRTGVMDAVVVGGAESNLSPGMYAVFSRVGALARDASLPFDSRTEGLVQGEGAGLFVIKRLRDARAKGDQILAVLEASDGSSDGKTSSLFQPNSDGQKLSYTRVHSELGGGLIAHMEAHGTGTQVGDVTEARSLAEAFPDQAFPVSSIKSLLGHTKGAAGAAGLIKTIFMMKERRIPASPYLQSPLQNVGKIFFPKDEIRLESTDSEKLFCVSGFGFGGTNYHVAVRAPREDVKPEVEKPKSQDEETYLVGQSEMSFDEFNPHWFMSPESPYRLPPQSVHKIDRAQLLAVQVTHQALKAAGLSPDILPNQDVLTISASILGLDLCSDLAGRLQVSALKGRIAEKPLTIGDQDVALVTPLLEEIKDRFQACSEDHAPGLLNNVVAGRVCQAFNLKGRSYNIEAGVASKDYGYFLADMELKLERARFVFLIYLEEDFKMDRDFSPVRRARIGCSILAREQTCREYFLKADQSLAIGMKN